MQGSYPDASADFVEQTWNKVLADQQRIADEAKAVEDIQFPKEFLAEHQVPNASDGFVEQTLQKVLGQQESPLEFADSPDLQPLLHHYQAPNPSDEFVERTLQALRPRPQARSQARPLARPLNWRSWAVAAALVLLGLSLFLRQASPTTLGFVPATSFSPVPWSTRMSAMEAEHNKDAELPWNYEDGLVTLARVAKAGGGT